MAFLSLVVRFEPSPNGFWRCKWPIWAVFHFLAFLSKKATFEPDHGLDMRDLVDLGPKSTSPRISDRPSHETCPKWVKMGFYGVFVHLGVDMGHLRSSIRQSILSYLSGMSLLTLLCQICHFWGRPWPWHANLSRFWSFLGYPKITIFDHFWGHFGPPFGPPFGPFYPVFAP